ncbi:MAG: inverse autotransporter beta domain-containing protein, partial [Planctomycetales bacterium]
MRRIAKIGGLWLILLGATATTVFGQPTQSSPDAGFSPPVMDGEQPFTEDFSAVSGVPNFGGYFRMRHIVGEGVGRRHSFTSLDYFQPVRTQNGVFFAEARNQWDNTADYAGHGGVGFRTYNPDWNRVFGASGWFDYDSFHAASYNQVGISLESLGQYFDVRSNVYYPLDDSPVFVTQMVGGQPRFTPGNNILLNLFDVFEIPYRGWDFEVATPVPFLQQFGVQAGFGFYGYETDPVGDDFWGGSGRVEAQLSEKAWTQLAVYVDETFDTNVVWTVAITPFGRRRQGGAWRTVEDRLIEQVRRNDNVVAGPVIVPTGNSVLAINPVTNDPYQVVHVTRGGTSGGTGTFIDPFTSLPDAEAALTVDDNILFAWEGSNFTNAITLPADIRFLGEGVRHSLVTTAGNIFLPSSPNAGDGLPVIGGALDPAVVLTGNNEVSGFQFTDNVVSIANLAAGGADGALIQQNIFTGNTANAVGLFDS